MSFFPNVILLVVGAHVACLCRRWFWIVPSEWPAWSLTLILSVVLLRETVRTRRELGLAEAPPRAFAWLFALPMTAYFLWRVPFPDLAGDLGNYHIVNAERALRGFPSLTGDFFAAFYDPSSDMVTGVFRHLLGYRFGTIVNLLTMLWIGYVAERLLRKMIPGSAARALAVLWLCLCEGMLLELNGYYVDLLAIPLLLEACVILRDGRAGKRRIDFYFGLLLSLSACLKTANVPFAIALFAWRALKQGSRGLGDIIAGALAPLLPYYVWIFLQTGNPLHPFLAGLLPSVVSFPRGPLDFRFGPTKWWEFFVWPVLIVWNPGRGWEFPSYSGRLALGCAAALALLFYPARKGSVDDGKSDAKVFLFGSASWILISGNVRYAFFLETLGGLCVLAMLNRMTFRPARVALVIALAAQSLFAVRIASEFDAKFHGRWAKPERWATEAQNLFRDRSLVADSPPEDIERLAAVEGWVKASWLEAGRQVQMCPDLPMINLFVRPDNPRGRRLAADALQSIGEHSYYALCGEDQLQACIATLRSWHLSVGEMKIIVLTKRRPDEAHPWLIRVLPKGRGRISFARVRAGPTTSLVAGLAGSLIAGPARPRVLEAGKSKFFHFRVRNTGRSRGPPGRAPTPFAWAPVGSTTPDESATIRIMRRFSGTSVQTKKPTSLTRLSRRLSAASTGCSSGCSKSKSLGSTRKHLRRCAGESRFVD